MQDQPSKTKLVAVIAALVVLIAIVLWAAVSFFTLGDEQTQPAQPSTPPISEEVTPQEPAHAELPRTGVGL